MKISLYNLTTEFQFIEAQLDNPEISQEEKERLQKEITTLIQEKTDNVVMYQHSLEDLVEAIEKRVADLNALKKTVNNRMAQYENYLISCLGNLGTEKVQGQFYEIKIPKPREKVAIADENLLPAQFLKTKTEVTISVKEIGDALKSGEVVPGASLVSGNKSIKFSTRTK